MADFITSSYLIPGKGSYETLQKISAWNVKALAKLAGLQFELATLGIETSVAQAKLLSLSNSYDQFYTHESRLANLYGSRIAQISRETTDVMFKSGDELNTLIGSIFTAAKDGMVAKTPAVAQKQIVKAVAKRPAVNKPAAKKPVKRKLIKKTH